MSLLKPIDNGRMYPGWSRWNPIAGCEHGCSYCYLLPMQERLKRDMMTPVFRNGENGTKNYLRDDLGYHETYNPNNKIFVCSSGDMWGEWVNNQHICDVLSRCGEDPDNECMFLTKNPDNYRGWGELLDRANYILGATIETDRHLVGAALGSAPSVLGRLGVMADLKQVYTECRFMISIEPVAWFTNEFPSILRAVAPDIVYVGVDSGKNNLPEPSPEELQGLIDELGTFTDVRLKAGIERILGKPCLSPAVKVDDVEIIQEPREPVVVPKCL